MDDPLSLMYGTFDAAPPEQQEAIKELLGAFHFRDGKRYDDGSMGTVHISPKQFRDLLAWWAKQQSLKGNGNG